VTFGPHQIWPFSLVIASSRRYFLSRVLKFFEFFLILLAISVRAPLSQMVGSFSPLPTSASFFSSLRDGSFFPVSLTYQKFPIREFFSSWQLSTFLSHFGTSFTPFNRAISSPPFPKKFPSPRIFFPCPLPLSRLIFSESPFFTSRIPLLFVSRSGPSLCLSSLQSAGLPFLRFSASFPFCRLFRPCCGWRNCVPLLFFWMRVLSYLFSLV